MRRHIIRTCFIPITTMVAITNMSHVWTQHDENRHDTSVSVDFCTISTSDSTCIKYPHIDLKTHCILRHIAYVMSLILGKRVMRALYYFWVNCVLEAHLKDVNVYGWLQPSMCQWHLYERDLRRRRSPIIEKNILDPSGIQAIHSIHIAWHSPPNSKSDQRPLLVTKVWNHSQIP